MAEQDRFPVEIHILVLPWKRRIDVGLVHADRGWWHVCHTKWVGGEQKIPGWHSYFCFDTCKLVPNELEMKILGWLSELIATLHCRRTCVWPLAKGFRLQANASSSCSPLKEAGVLKKQSRKGVFIWNLDKPKMRRTYPWNPKSKSNTN